jgi:hypothetical protein
MYASERVINNISIGPLLLKIEFKARMPHIHAGRVGSEQVKKSSSAATLSTHAINAARPSGMSTSCVEHEPEEVSCITSASAL